MHALSQSKIKAFNVGRMNPLKKHSAFIKKKEEKEHKKKVSLMKNVNNGTIDTHNRPGTQGPLNSTI